MNLFSKFLIFISIVLTLAVFRIGTVAQESESIDPQIIKYNDYYRFSFRAGEYVPFDLMIDGSDIIVDFEKANNLDLSKYIYKNSIIKSFGTSNDSKSFIIKLNADGAKVRKFITDNNTTGFDLYVSGVKSDKKTIMMSALPEEQAAELEKIKAEGKTPIPESFRNVAGGAIFGPFLEDDADAEEKSTPVNQYAKTQIITFPPEFIGPPKAQQLVRNSDEFVGPIAYDPTIYSVYEIMKTAAKGAIIPDVVVEENGFALTFPLTDIDSVSAAAIDRDGVVTIIFNSINTIQLADLMQNGFIKKARIIPDPKYRIVEITLNKKKMKKDTYNEAFYKDKVAWTFELYLQDAENKKFEVTPVTLGAESNFGEKRIVATATDIVGPAELSDASTGEKIKVFLLKDNASGVTLPREYVDLKFLPSMQGIFLQEKSDYLTYDIAAKKMTITKLSNLQISDDIIASDIGETKASLLASAKIKGVYPENSIFPFQTALDVRNNVKKEPEEKDKDKEAKKEEEPEKHEEAGGHGAKKEEVPAEEAVLDLQSNADAEEAELQQNIIDDTPKDTAKKVDISNTTMFFLAKIISATPDKKSDAKMELAEMYFSKGFYVEAMGTLQDIKITDPAYKDMFKVKTMIAACEFLSEQYSEAFDGFSDTLSVADKDKNYSEIRLWQWASKTMYDLKTRNNNDAPIDIDFTSSYDKFMQQYPLSLSYRLGMMYIDEKIKAGKIDDAKNILEIISYNGVPKKYGNDTLFTKAILADKEGNSSLSTKIYNKLIADTDDRKNRARSIVELTKNQLLKSQITNDAAIQKFLDASTVWRDDYFEMDVLEIVGHLYVAQKNYIKALDSWKQIANNFPETTESVFILGKMKQLFIDLFDGGIAYKMKPLDTLKLYFGFRELTPAGEIGDSITRKVAQFFITADMMDEAIKIVEHQIKYRSYGDEKAKLGLWLYKINIDNRDLDGAERALKLVKESETSPLLVKDKHYDQTMITALRGEYQAALDAVKNDFTSPAEQIRTELFWQKENWFGVINTVEARLKDIRETKPLPLTKDEMNDINRLMVAYAAQGENRKLVNIRNEFSNRIPDNDDQLLFDYLTAGSKPIDYNDFENSVELGQIENFLNDYTFMPTQSWDSSIKILQPKVALLVGKPADDLTRSDKLAIVKLAIAYSMMSTDEKEGAEMKKNIANMTRDFKDLRVDRTTIDAFNIFDDKFMPKENDAVFEGKIKISDIPTFIDYYKRANKFSELNISIRDKFKN